MISEIKKSKMDKAVTRCMNLARMLNAVWQYQHCSNCCSLSEMTGNFFVASHHILTNSKAAFATAFLPLTENKNFMLE